MNKIGNDIAYFNFEDPRIFGFDLNDFDKLDENVGYEISNHYYKANNNDYDYYIDN
jgi:hypothetical protein